MTNKIENLQTLRNKIDNIDEEILKLIQLRSQLALNIVDAKSGTNIYKPKREEALINNLIEKGKSSNPEYIESIWRLLISENLKLQGGLKIITDNSRETLKTVNWYFNYGASITSEKSATKAFQKLTLGTFDAAIVLDNKIQRNILKINNKVIKKILTVPLTNISTFKKVAIFRIE